MYFHKKTTYPGRWLVKLFEAGLIFGLIFLTVEALQRAFTPTITDDAVVITAPVQQVEVVRVEPQRVEPEAAPEYSDYDYFEMGYNHQVDSEYYEAIVDYTRALELNPYFGSAWLNRGVAYEQLNNDYRAMQDFNQFLHREGLEVLRHQEMLVGASLDVEMAEGRVYEIVFFARAGQLLNISAVSKLDDVVDPLVVVVDSEGNPVAARDDVLRQDGSLIKMDSYINNFEVLRTGRYMLRVSHAGGGSYGMVRVNLEIND